MDGGVSMDSKEIKYHEYRKDDSEYDEKGYLTNNWNPDIDYGNEYVKVYFNLNTPTYNDFSFTNNDDRKNWYKETEDVISGVGVMKDCGYHNDHSPEKKEWLYAHPQQISGVIKKNNVKAVVELIGKMKLSTLRWVDLHDTYYVISDDEYEKYLNSKDYEMKKEIFKICKTNRRTLFHDTLSVCQSVAERFKMNRFGIPDGYNCNNSQTIKHVRNLIFKMKEEKLLVMAREGQFVRSINKTEQKRLKVEVE